MSKAPALAPWFLALATPAAAALPVGAPAPASSAAATTGQAPVPIDLLALGRAGPLVIFVFPSVSIGGGSEECRDFAANLDQFRAAGANVIGLTRDPLDQIAPFAQVCGGKISIVSADLALITALDVNDSANFATRTTYVIADGRIAFVRDEDDYATHARAALASVLSLKR